MVAPSRILLIQLRRFGDVVLTTPLANDLRKEFPAARVDFMVGKAAAPLLNNNPDISDVVVFDPKKLFAAVSEVRRRRYDWLVDVQVHPKTALLAAMSGIPVRAGWDARFWGMAYTHRTPRDASPMYVVRNRRRLLELLGVTPGTSLPRLYLSPEEIENGRREAAALGAREGAATVGIAIGTHDPERDWSVDSFAEVAATLQEEGVNVIVFRFPGDEAVIRDFRSITDAGVLAEWNGDRRFFGVLASCDVLLSPNTGPSHFALALDVPRVTLYGKDAELWSPGLPTTVAVTNPRQKCLGCGKNECPVKRSCLLGIRPSEVVDAVTTLLGARRGSSGVSA